MLSPLVPICFKLSDKDNVFSANVVVVNTRVHVIIVVVQQMATCVISCIAEIQAPSKSLFLVDNNQLLVVRPEEW